MNYTTVDSKKNFAINSNDAAMAEHVHKLLCQQINDKEPSVHIVVSQGIDLYPDNTAKLTALSCTPVTTGMQDFYKIGVICRYSAPSLGHYPDSVGSRFHGVDPTTPIDMLSSYYVATLTPDEGASAIHLRDMLNLLGNSDFPTINYVVEICVINPFGRNQSIRMIGSSPMISASDKSLIIERYSDLMFYPPNKNTEISGQISKLIETMLLN